LKGPVLLRLKNPIDPTKEITINVLLWVKRGTITLDDIRKLRDTIYREAVHLVLVVTDQTLSPEIQDELSLLPQVIVMIVDLRDLIKLLVISLAKRRDIPVDDDLLAKAYSTLYEKYKLANQLEQWFRGMLKEGFILSFEGFSRDVLNALRFFINTSGEELTLQEIWEFGWNLRNLLPFGIESGIAPDIGFKVLDKSAKILEDYGFLKKAENLYKLVRHPSEDRVIELLEYCGGSISKDRLKRYFIFREPASYVFDNLLAYMSRKMLISIDKKGHVSLLKLSELQEKRQSLINRFYQKKFEYTEFIRGHSFIFNRIVTWKKKKTQIISISEMERTIEEISEKISTAVNEDVKRACTFILAELVEWYSYYVDKLLSAIYKSEENIRSLESNLKSLEERFNEWLARFSMIIGSEIAIQLQELKEVSEKLNEIKEYSLENLSDGQLEDEIKRTETFKSIQRNKTTVDIDLRMESRGDWTVAEYILVFDKIHHLNDYINAISEAINLLNSLLDKLESLFRRARSMLRSSVPANQPITNALKSAFTQTLKTITKKPLLPPNVIVVSVDELKDSLSNYISNLENDIKEAEAVHSEICLLENAEASFINVLLEIKSLERLYTKFWEEAVPALLRNEYERLNNDYSRQIEMLEQKLDSLYRFSTIRREVTTLRSTMERMNTLCQKLRHEYRKLFDDPKEYLRTGLKFVNKFKEKIVPKLTKSNITKLNEILNEIYAYYSEILSLVESLIEEASKRLINVEELRISRSKIVNEESVLRRKLVNEVKDLSEEETLILLNIIKAGVQQRSRWVSLSEICNMVAKEVEKSPEDVMKTVFNLYEKRFLMMGVSF